MIPVPTPHWFKHIATVAGGTAFSQAILMLAALLLTRLYTPTDFGTLAVLISLLSLLLVIVSLRYELAIPKAANAEEASHLLTIALTLVIIISVITGGLFWLFSSSIAKWTKLTELTHYLGWLLIALLGAGSYQALKYFCYRHQLFHLVSLTQMGQSLTQVSLQLILGWWQFGSVGLISGYVIAQGVGIITLWRRIKTLLVPIHWQRGWEVAKLYQHFPLYTLWASLLNVLGWQLPPLLFAIYFPLTVAGWYALTMRVLAMPSALIGQAVAQVFYPLAAQVESQPEETKALLEKTASLLLLISLPVFGLLLIQGAFVFKLIFGADWEMAGHYAQWLTPWFMTAFISSPLSTLALVKSRQRQALWLSGYEILLRLMALSIGIYGDSPQLAIQLFSAAGVIISGVYLAWIFHLVNANCWQWLIRLKGVILVNALVITGLFVAGHWLAPWQYFGISVVSMGMVGIWFFTKTLKQPYQT